MLIVSNKYESLDRILEAARNNISALRKDLQVAYTNKIRPYNFVGLETGEALQADLGDSDDEILSNAQMLLSEVGIEPDTYTAEVTMDRKISGEFKTVKVTFTKPVDKYKFKEGDVIFITDHAEKATKDGVSKISTAVQESITCDLFTKILNKEITGDVTEEDVLEAAHKYVDNPPKDWLNSWKYQCNQLKKSSLDAINNLKKSSGNITVCRTPDLGKFGYDIVKTTISDLAKINRVSSAAIDSSDIYCIQDGSKSDIESKLKKASAIKNPDTKQKRVLSAFNDLFNSGKLVGISLKKVKSDNSDMTIPNATGDTMPTIENITYKSRKTKEGNLPSLNWVCTMSDGRDVEFNLRDNGKGTTRFELTYHNQRIGDVPAGVWKDSSNADSLYSVLNVNTPDMNTLAKACSDNSIDWNEDRYKSVFLYYYNLAAKISPISVSHILSM